MFRAGLYTRVSTNDQQTIPFQIRALREYAVRRGWMIALQVKEVGSGASERQLREKLLHAARRREIDVVLVWRLDRWGRSVADLLATLQELDHLGVGFVSLTEALDLTTPAGRAMAALLAVFADYAERGIMRRHWADVPFSPACHESDTSHNNGPNREGTPRHFALRPHRTVEEAATRFMLRNRTCLGLRARTSVAQSITPEPWTWCLRQQRPRL